MATYAHATFDTEGARMVSVSDDTTIKIWACAAAPGGEPNWKCIQTIAGEHDRPIYGVSWSRANGMIATASGDNSIKIFAAPDPAAPFARVHAIEGAHALDVNCVAWHPGRPDVLVSASDDQSIHVWRISSAK